MSLEADAANGIPAPHSAYDAAGNRTSMPFSGSPQIITYDGPRRATQEWGTIESPDPGRSVSDRSEQTQTAISWRTTEPVPLGEARCFLLCVALSGPVRA